MRPFSNYNNWLSEFRRPLPYNNTTTMCILLTTLAEVITSSSVPPITKTDIIEMIPWTVTAT